MLFDRLVETTRIRLGLDNNIDAQHAQRLIEYWGGMLPDAWEVSVRLTPIGQLPNHPLDQSLALTRILDARGGVDFIDYAIEGMMREIAEAMKTAQRIGKERKSRG
jgi:hypothetical protein